MKPLQDYSFVRGVCHSPDPGTTPEQWERDFEFCERLHLNAVRFWMSQEDWENDPDSYKRRILCFMDICAKHGVQCMPILWNGNFIAAFQEPTPEQWAGAEAYARDMIAALRSHDALLMWDVINEPMCNDYLRHCEGALYDERFGELTRYTRRLVSIVRELDTENCLTVGHERVDHCHSTADLVDVISYHCYLTTRRDIEDAILRVKQLALEHGGKPVLNTETGCIGRANPYEVELEMAARHHVGWFLFNLICEGFWSDVHGLVYPDGTIRDPAVIAAIFGFFRNRTESRVPANANREGHAYRAVKAVEDVLRVEETSLFMNKPKTTDDVLAAAEYCVNILEAAELVPMWNPPSARIECWRRIPEEMRDPYEIRRFAYDMAQLLKQSCMF